MVTGRKKARGGGLMAATERLKRQGLRGGGLCKRGMNREAIGKIRNGWFKRVVQTRLGRYIGAKKKGGF